MVARDPSRPHVLVAYERLLREEGSTSVCAAAIQALTEDIARSSATTMMGLRDELRAAGEVLKQSPDAPISLASLCELFVRFVTRIAMKMVDAPDFADVKRLLKEYPPMLLEMVKKQ